MKTSGEILIPASPSEVYEVLADPTWLSAESSSRVELLSDEEPADGTRVVKARTYTSGGVAVDSRSIYFERVSGERIRLRTTIGPLIRSAKGQWGFVHCDLESTITLEARRNGTLVNREDAMRYRPILLHPLFVVLMRAMNRRPTQAALRRLLTEFSR